MDDDEGWGPNRRGMEFGLNLGVYQASHNPAQVYGGYPSGDEGTDNNSLPNYFNLGNNQYVFRSLPGSLEDMIPGQLSLVQTELGFENKLVVWDYPREMRYDPAMMFGIKGAYFFNDENSLMLSLNTVSLRASGGYQLVNENQTNNLDAYLDYSIFAKERRYLTSLGYRTSIYINDYSTWIIGLGGTSTTVQIIRNWFNIENFEYDLIRPNVPISSTNSNSTPTIRNTSNTGFGFYGIIGLEGMFEKGGNLQANFRVSRDRIKLGHAEDTGEPGLTGYNRINWNFALFITWMIPPQVGDFVRASF